MAVFQGVEIVIKVTVPQQNVVILSLCYYGVPALWIARYSFKIMVSLIIYTLRVREGFVLPGYRKNWMSQKNN